ncbi:MULTISPECIES: hypothetical protein [Halorussus]|uniref:hypothetical protein n=1 Tax=Halorussus TaxID=1070314 RepID=UPI0020A1C58E|nr:hypothetical protein [Halorussus vallis]USZ78650.1 hypothetical protein NGM07_25205 [Halorussus vallis]USZ78681.1 hypothetical protein NGM07_24535 [Halorussus vallis]
MNDQQHTHNPDGLEAQFGQFFRRYYSDEIGNLARNYPTDRALYVDWTDLYQYDNSLADDLLSNGSQLREYAEEALRNYDLPIDVSLGRASFRVRNLPDEATFDVGDYRVSDLGSLLAIEGEVVWCSEVEPFAEDAAFACQRCGTLTYIPQSFGDLREPAECQGCEQQGPFTINQKQSELVDYRKLKLEAVDSNLADPPTLDAAVKEDLVDRVGPGDFVTVVGVYKTLPQQDDCIFDTYVDVWDIDRDVDAKADKLSKSALEDRILAFVEGEQASDEFGVPQQAVVDDLANEGVREEETTDRIAELVEDANEPLDEIGGGRLMMR